MMKRFLSILLALTMLCAIAGAEGVRGSVTLYDDNNSVNFTVTGGTSANGSTVLNLTGLTNTQGRSDSINRSVVLDPSNGLLLEKDGEWRSLSLMGYTLGGSSKNSPSVGDLLQQLVGDLSSMEAAFNNAAARFQQSDALSSLTQKLSNPANMTLTAADLNAVGDAFINEYFIDLLGMVSSTKGSVTSLTTGSEVPALIAGTQLEAVWSQVWSLMDPQVRVNRLPQFSLTTNCKDDQGIISLTSDVFSITFNYQQERYTNNYTFTAMGNMNGSTFTANGTLTRSTLTLEVVGQDFKAEGLVTLGTAPAFTFTVTDTSSYSDEIIASLIGSVTGSGLTATLTAGNEVYTLDLSGSANGGSLVITNRRTYDSIFSPRMKLQASISATRLYGEYTAGSKTQSITLTKNADSSYSLNLTEFNSYSNRSQVQDYRLTPTATGYTLTCNRTSYFGNPELITINLYTGKTAYGSDEAAKLGYEVTTTSGTDTTGSACVLERTSDQSYTLRLFHEDRYDKDETLVTVLSTGSMVSATVTTTQTNKWNNRATTDTYTAVATVDSESAHLDIDLGYAVITGVLTPTDDRNADVALSVKNNGTEVFWLKGVLTISEDGNTMTLNGSMDVDNSGHPVNITAALSKNVAISNPILPASIGNIDLTNAMQWMFN